MNLVFLPLLCNPEINTTNSSRNQFNHPQQHKHENGERLLKKYNKMKNVLILRNTLKMTELQKAMQ